MYTLEITKKFTSGTKAGLTITERTRYADPAVAEMQAEAQRDLERNRITCRDFFGHRDNYQVAGVKLTKGSE